MLVKFCDAVSKCLYYALVAMGLILIGAVTLLVAARYVPFVPRWLWPLEIANWAMIWMVFIGASIAVRENKHFNVDLWMGKTPSRGVLLFLKLVYYVFVGFVTLTFVLFGYGFVVKWALIQTSEVLTINMAYLYVSVPIAGLLWLLFLVEDCYREFFMPKSRTREAR